MHLTGAGRQILIVDDQAEYMAILKAFLSEAGFSVICAYGAEDAIRKVKRRPPDLVLTDLVMPGTNGVDLIAMLKHDAETAHIPVIAVTSYIWDGIAQAAGRFGCDGFVGKPIERAKLLAEIHKLLSPHAAAAPAA